MENKIAMIIPNMYNGGAQKVFINLAKGFIDRNLDVDLLLIDASGPYLKKLHPKVKVIDLKAKKTSKSLFPLIKYLRDNRPRVLLSALNHTNVLSAIAMRLSKVDTKLVISIHSVISLKSKEVTRKTSKLMYRLFGLVLRQSDYIVAVSEGIAKDISSNYVCNPNKIFVINNPIDIRSIASSSCEEVEHIWFSNKEYPIIIFAGRLEPVKDLDTLINGFVKARQKKKMKLVILGDGSEKAKLLAKKKHLNCKDDIEIMGFVDNPYKYINKSDLFILSSIREGFPNVLIESIALGVPILSTDCESGPGEIIGEDYKIGRLVPIGDSESLANQIIECLETEFSSDYIKEYSQKYSVDYIVNEYLKIFNNHSEKDDSVY